METDKVKIRNKPTRSRLFAFFVCGVTSIGVVASELTGKDLYQSLCASCHGEDLRGARGSSLVDEDKHHGRDRESLYRTIQEGIVAKGMPGFRDLLTETQINQLIDFIDAVPSDPHAQSATSQLLETLDYTVQVTVVVDGLEVP